MSITRTPYGAVGKALAHLRASGGIEYDREAFATALSSGIAAPQVSVAVEAHMREADAAELVDLVAEGSASLDSLAKLAERLLEPSHPNAECLRQATS